MTSELIARNHNERLRELLLQGQLDELERLASTLEEELQALPLIPEELLRSVDDLPRQTVLKWLSCRPPFIDELKLIRLADRLLGRRKWPSLLQRFQANEAATLVAVLTWQCEVRCTYCKIPKQAGKEMPDSVLRKAEELLFSSPHDQLELRYFGGEPLLEWPLIQRSIGRTQTRLKDSQRCQDRSLRYMITTNGYALTADKIKWLSEYPVTIQLSLDGLPEAHNTHRKAVDSAVQSYDFSGIDKAPLLNELGIDTKVIMVVHPARLEHFLDDFSHLSEQGFRSIQLNWAHFSIWKPQHLELFSAGLHQLGAYLHQRWSNKQGPWLINLGETMRTVRTATELTVDWDGTVFANNGFLFRQNVEASLRLGHLDDVQSWMRYHLDAPVGEDLDDRTFADRVWDNNTQVGVIFNSWLRWMQDQGWPAGATTAFED